jgi:hypothetical protein
MNVGSHVFREVKTCKYLRTLATSIKLMQKSRWESVQAIITLPGMQTVNMYESEKYAMTFSSMSVREVTII